MNPKIKFKPGYYYLHTSSQVVWKPFIVVDSDPDYFNSPHVVNHWKVETVFDYQYMMKKAKRLDNGV